MPSSNKEGKDVITNWICDRHKNIQSVLDLGVGEGTYAKLFKIRHRYLHRCKWIGVEVWKPYITKYNLNMLYDVLYNEDIREFDYSQLGKVDITFAGDVLEHIYMHQAIDVMNKLSLISRYVVVSIPIINMPQGIWFNNPYEIHLEEDWSHDKVMNSFANIKEYFVGRKIGAYWIDNT